MSRKAAHWISQNETKPASSIDLPVIPLFLSLVEEKQTPDSPGENGMDWVINYTNPDN